MRDKLRSARKRAGITQNDLAETVGISRSQYSLIECGLRNPTYGGAVRMAERLMVPVERLFSDHEGFKLKQNLQRSATEGGVLLREATA